MTCSSPNGFWQDLATRRDGCCADVSPVEHVHLVVLNRGRCGGEHLHELTHARRLLASSVRANCGHVIAKSLPDLRWAYVGEVRSSRSGSLSSSRRSAR
jgi:hypothetical protein